MYSRWINLFVFITLNTSLVLCQITKEGYVGINFNAGGSLTGSGNIAKSYEGVGHAAGSNLEGTITKTIEVPAPAIQSSIYFEKQIAPVVVEKEVIKKVTTKPVVTEKVVSEEVVHVPQNVYVRKVHARRPVQRRKYVYVDAHSEVAPARVGFLSKLFAVGAAPAPVAAPIPASEMHIEKQVKKDVVVPQNTATYSATATVNKNGQLFNDIFNIPISTLQAVNQLVNNIAGSVTVSKQINTHVAKPSSAEVYANANSNAHTGASAYINADAHVHS